VTVRREVIGMSVKDELHTLVDALPEREWRTARRLLTALIREAEPDAPGAHAEHAAFFASPTVEELAARQGVTPVIDPDDLLGDFWPEDERADDFIAAVRRWRREGGDG
jgi:hypothetical protein